MIGCGGFIVQEREISSPSDVTKIDKYYGGINCRWNITAPLNMKVVVRYLNKKSIQPYLPIKIFLFLGSHFLNWNTICIVNTITSPYMMEVQSK